MKTLRKIGCSLAAVSFVIIASISASESKLPNKGLFKKRFVSFLIQQEHFKHTELSGSNNVVGHRAELQQLLDENQGKNFLVNVASILDVKKKGTHKYGEEPHIFLEEEVEEDPNHLLAYLLQETKSSFIWDITLCRKNSERILGIKSGDIFVENCRVIRQASLLPRGAAGKS